MSEFLHCKQTGTTWYRAASVVRCKRVRGNFAHYTTPTYTSFSFVYEAKTNTGRSRALIHCVRTERIRICSIGHLQRHDIVLFSGKMKELWYWHSNRLPHRSRIHKQHATTTSGQNVTKTRGINASRITISNYLTNLHKIVDGKRHATILHLSG